MRKKYLVIMDKDLGVSHISVAENDITTSFDFMIKNLFAARDMSHAKDNSRDKLKKYNFKQGYQLLSHPSFNEVDKNTIVSSRKGNVFIVITGEYKSTQHYVPVDIAFGFVERQLQDRMTENIIPDSEDEKNSVFIVHGHDKTAKTEVARFVESIGFKVIILHEQASQSMTIIEKLEHYTDSGFGIVLYTPCDEGRKIGDQLKPRARQNVVFEHGFLIAKLGRPNVMALVKDNIDLPGDLSGVVFESMDDSGAWKLKLVKELKMAGFIVDMDKL